MGPVDTRTKLRKIGHLRPPSVSAVEFVGAFWLPDDRDRTARDWAHEVPLTATKPSRLPDDTKALAELAHLYLQPVTTQSAEWHEAVAAAMDRPDATFPPPWYPAAKVGDFDILPIEKSAELYREGAAMHHCIGTYIDAVQSGECYVYSVRQADKRIATFALVRCAVSAALSQIRGPCNAQVPEKTVAAVRRWLRAQPPLPSRSNGCEIAGSNNGRSLVEAETLALSCCVTEWLNQHPSPSPSGRCAWCGKGESPGAALLPFGIEPGAHAWLHAECWPVWHQARQADAIAALATMGIGSHDDPP